MLEMKILIYIVLFAFMLPAIVLGQTESTPLILTCGTFVTNSYFINGTVFYPKTQVNNRLDSKISLCDNYKHIFYLEGLPLTEKQFIEIGIKHKDFLKNKSEYTYEYNNNDTMACVKFIHLFVRLSIPIKLNGLELKDDEREKILRDLTIEKITTIIRRSGLKKRRIEITTI